MILRKELSHLLVSAGVLLAGLALHASQVLTFTNADDLPTTVKVMKGYQSAVLDLEPGQSGTVDLKAEEGKPVEVTLKVSSQGGPDETETRELEFVYKIRENPEGEGMQAVLTMTAANIPLGAFTFEDDYHLSFSWAPWPLAQQKNFKALERNHRDQVWEQVELRHAEENWKERLRRAQLAEREAARRRKAAEGHGCTCVIL